MLVLYDIFFDFANFDAKEKVLQYY